MVLPTFAVRATQSAAVLKMEASMRNNSLDRQLTEMGLGAAVDAGGAVRVISVIHGAV